MSQQTSSVLYPPTSKGYLEFTGKPVAVKEGTGFDKSQELDSEIQNLHEGYDIGKIVVTNGIKYSDGKYGILPDLPLRLDFKLDGPINQLSIGSANAIAGTHRVVPTNSSHAQSIYFGDLDNFGTVGEVADTLLGNQIGKGGAYVKVYYKIGNREETLTMKHTNIFAQCKLYDSKSGRKDYNLFNAALAKQDGYDKNEITRIDVSLFYTTEVKVPYDGIFAKTKKQKQDWVAKYQFNFVKAKNRSINK